MPSKVPCVRCGTDCTGDDDHQNTYLGDIHLSDPCFDGTINLCEKCKQGLNTVVEDYLLTTTAGQLRRAHKDGGPAPPEFLKALETAVDHFSIEDEDNTTEEKE